MVHSFIHSCFHMKRGWCQDCACPYLECPVQEANTPTLLLTCIGMVLLQVCGILCAMDLLLDNMSPTAQTFMFAGMQTQTQALPMNGSNGGICGQGFPT
jgi:hypothetical protein